MSWWGKVVGGVFGAMLFGPLGAVLGAALGHGFDSGLLKLDREAVDPADDPGGWTARERVQTAFFTATFSVMGHVSKADGAVSREEIAVASELMQRMRLNEAQRQLAQNLFRQGRAPDFDITGVIDQLRDECRGRPDLIQVFLEVQLSAAHVDGRVHPGEREVLDFIRQRLRVRPVDFERIEALVEAQFAHLGAGGGTARPSIADAYAVLGVDRDASDEQVKRAYRRLMSRHHPDKLVAQGLPEEMVQVATEKSKEISLAYERICQERGL